ncbi:indole-3-glycerol phosphate synthase TrpC [Bacillus sp. ISL-47]|uniref:indole-3-glycerol phosphate synthase TrpC n=1 Tax=Bacillus sp. ISL-47 TaxID=2819130 RepID=UPI001BEC8593|nr:indole-3-glycerol phosphate synthase TrpC [Bacillus sp. ISL-47]MBT2689328.1 indole-3-glycerol phosphate synthase TrpC [Bacillus sp. ISL-47]MBT2707219.1 indole-3-glycerol phosphate synthase TrpC [Pseudomonas sp. ISL-84]
METILDKILAEKRKEIMELHEKKETEKADLKFEKHSFISRLEKENELAVIAEFKRASPSKGDINISQKPEEQALFYKNFGADAISVLTDRSFFKGSFSDLTAVRETVDLPILCKDFIIDEAQILKAKAAGANLILLIVAAMDAERLKELYNFALEQELEVLMEIHNEEELETALETGTKLIGVNNRNLKTFEVNLEATEKLAPAIKKAGRFLISESGIKTEEDVHRVIAAGANGILVGEAFMKADNLEGLLKAMKLPLQGAVKQ